MLQLLFIALHHRIGDRLETDVHNVHDLTQSVLFEQMHEAS